MKNYIFLLCLFASSVSAIAQTAGSNGTAAHADSIGTTLTGLPVHKSFVPDDAVERAKKKYGRALYSIEKSTQADCQQSYLVGLIRQGHLTMEWMCDDPKMVWRQQSVGLPSIVARRR